MKHALADLATPDMPSRFSVSFIGKSVQCMLKASMERQAGFGGFHATIGKAAHEIFATCSMRAQLMGLMQIHPDEAREVAIRVLNSPEESHLLTPGMYRMVLRMVERWAETVTFPLDADIWVIEHPFRIPVHDPDTGVVYTVSGRMDDVAIWDTHYRNLDWKTGPGLPSWQRVMEEHTQLPLYALAALREWPWLETFECTEFYTRRCVPRTISLHRDDIPELEAWLLAQCRAIAKSYNEGVFEANPDPRWCGVCPAPERCPFPEWVRPASVLDTEEDAIDHLRAMVVEKARVEKRRGAARGWMEANDVESLVVGGRRYGFIEKTVKRVDYDAVDEILAAAGTSRAELTTPTVEVEFGDAAA